VCVHIQIHVCIRVYTYTDAGCRRPIGCLIFTGHFPPKSPIYYLLFCENDFQSGARQAEGPKPPRTKGVRPEPIRMCYSPCEWCIVLLSFFHFSPRNRTSETPDLELDATSLRRRSWRLGSDLELHVTTRRLIADLTSASSETLVYTSDPKSHASQNETSVDKSDMEPKSYFRWGRPPISQNMDKINGKRAR